MALRTAPCPSCSSTIVFGERKCRKCAMVFDYGPNPPPEPSQAEVFDALLTSGQQQTPSTPQRPPQQQQQQQQPPQHQPQRPAGQGQGQGQGHGQGQGQGQGIEGLDTGRFAVGDVEVEDIPGFIDSSLFKAMTPDHVDVTAVPGLETTHVEVGDVRAIAAVEVDAGRASVGDVAPAAAVPGLYGADMFKADVDIAAGGDQSPMLETTHIRVKEKTAATSTAKKKKLSDDDLPRIVCPSCGSTHQKPRCPSCATAHPLAEG